MINWQVPLVLDGKDPQVIGAGHQILFSCQEPGVPFRWTQIVHNGGNIYAARVLPIIVPADVIVSDGATCVDIIYMVGAERCWVLFTHEMRPYPALIKDAIGETLCEMPGGVIEASDVSVVSGAVREFLEEIGANPSQVLAHVPLISVPAPVSAGAQLEGQSLFCVVYRAGTKFHLNASEPITKISVVPLPEAYHWILGRHERKEECTEMKTLLALLALQQQYQEMYGVPLYVKEGGSHAERSAV